MLTPGGAFALVVAVQIAGLLGAATLVSAGAAAFAYVIFLAYAVLVAPTFLVARQVGARTIGHVPVGPPCYYGWYRFSHGEANELTLLLSATEPSVTEITDAVVTSRANPAGLRFEVREVATFGDAARVVLRTSGGSFDAAWHRRLRERTGAAGLLLGAELRFGGLTVAGATLSPL
jgi:hypothetical protein